MILSIILGIVCITIGTNSQNVVISPAKTAYATENKPLTLICNFAGRLTTKQVQWNRNGKTLATLLYKNGQCTERQSDGSTGKESFRYNCRDGLNWTILNIEERNHGENWSCSVDGMESEPTTIYVKVPVKYVNFTSPPGEYMLAEEKIPITFICNTSLERPRSEITWVFSFEYPLDPVAGTVLNKDNDALESTSASLRFYPFRAYGKFEAYCVAQNVESAAPVISNRKIIDVTYAPKVRLQHFHEVLIAEGGRVVLNSTVTSNPVSTCRWTFNDEILVEINGSEIVYEIDNISRHDEGYYICRCDNGVGYDGVGTMVRVFWRPQTISLSPITTTYSLEEGSLVPDISCSADCNPPCQLIWQKFNVYNASATVPVLNVPTIENPVLSIGHVTRADSGTYVCIGISFIPGFSPGSGIQNYKSPAIKISVF